MKIPLISQLLAHRLPSKNLGLAALVLGVLLPASSVLAQTTVVNSASAQPPVGVTNTNTGADGTGKVSASDTDSVLLPPKLTVTKAASANPLLRGVAGQYYDITITIANGPTTAAIVLNDVLPAGITLNGTPNKSSGTSNGTLSGCPTSGGNLSGCQIATGATNGTIVIRVPIQVAASATTGDNTAEVAGGGDPLCTVVAPCEGKVTVPVGNNAIVTTPDSGSV